MYLISGISGAKAADMAAVAPVLFPEIHYAIVVVLAMGLGLFSPPFGVGYYAACAIGRVDPNAGPRQSWPYMGALLAGLILVAAMPW